MSDATNNRFYRELDTLPIPLLVEHQREFAQTQAEVRYCDTCAGACPAPDACEQPDHTQPDRPVRVWNALRLLVLRPRLALLRWQLECIRDERERYDGLGWASPIYLRNCFQQELELMARIRQLETDQ